ncbi:MAG TPA: hypothetical protein VJ549_09060 [Geothrix sp.]|nr:hypothetical protein [Geothrix sp.]
MNFQSALPCLLLCGTLQAQVAERDPRGGGALKIGGTSYRFRPTSLFRAPDKGSLGGAIRLEGTLTAKEAPRPFHLALTLLKDGSLYMLRIERKAPGAYPESWAATRGTRILTKNPGARHGGRMEVQCEGPLTGIIAQRPQEAAWSGTLWVVFS